MRFYCFYILFFRFLIFLWSCHGRADQEILKNSSKYICSIVICNVYTTGGFFIGKLSLNFFEKLIYSHAVKYGICYGINDCGLM